jgi:hypothetical protein
MRANGRNDRKALRHLHSQALSLKNSTQFGPPDPFGVYAHVRSGGKAIARAQEIIMEHVGGRPTHNRLVILSHRELLGKHEVLRDTDTPWIKRVREDFEMEADSYRGQSATELTFGTLHLVRHPFKADSRKWMLTAELLHEDDSYAPLALRSLARRLIANTNHQLAPELLHIPSPHLPLIDMPARGPEMLSRAQEELHAASLGSITVRPFVIADGRKE